MARQLEVVGLDWETEFVPWFRIAWEPGDHLSVIAPTKAGKSTFVAQLLELRDYALALDPKGGDETIMKLGWPRLDRWPSDRELERLLDRAERKGQPFHYMVGAVTTRRVDLPVLKQTLGNCLDQVFDWGGFTVYVDELQLLTDRRMMNLAGKAATLLISARSRKVTFVSSFQAPSWVPSEAIRQPYWVAVSYTRDSAVVDRLAEVMGRNKAEMRGAIGELDEHVWLIVGRNPREPMRLTRPPAMKAKAA